MEILKLAVIFGVIVGVLALKKPLFLSIIAATVTTWLLFQVPADVFFFTIWQASVSWSTLSVLLLFYLVTFLQRMLELRGSLKLAQESLDDLFHSRRVTASLAPVFLGLLPTASVMPICGDIVEKSVGQYLTTEEKAFVTSYYRHIPESILPTFSSIMVSLSLTRGIVKTGSFVIAMLPMVLVLAWLGYIFYLRKIPKGTGTKSQQSKQDIVGICKGLWPIALILLLILAFDIPVYIAAAVSLALFGVTGRFSFAELKPMFKTAFEPRLIFSVFFIMLFKDVLAVTGVIEALPAILSALPLPGIIIFSLIFFLGTLISGSQAIAVLGIPLAFTAIPGAGLAQFVLLMGIAYAANQITPTHVCVVIAAEHFKIGFGALVKKTIPVIAAFCVILFMYYYLLLLIL